MHRILIPFVVAVGCGSPDPSAAPARPPSPEPASTAPPPADPAIPPSLWGRWGLTSADCDPGRSDNKGLLTVSERGLRFYESQGALGAVETREDGRIRASFDFTGEGQAWARTEDLALQGEDVLVRRLDGEGVPPEGYTYRRCAPPPPAGARGPHDARSPPPPDGPRP